MEPDLAFLPLATTLISSSVNISLSKKWRMIAAWAFPATKLMHDYEVDLA